MNVLLPAGPRQTESCPVGSRRHPRGHASSSSVPFVHSPRELPSLEQVNVVSPVNAPQPASAASPASTPPSEPADTTAAASAAAESLDDPSTDGVPASEI